MSFTQKCLQQKEVESEGSRTHLFQNQLAIVENSAKELHSTIIVCTDVGRVVTSLQNETG